MKSLVALINEGRRPSTFGAHLTGAFDNDKAPEQWEVVPTPADEVDILVTGHGRKVGVVLPSITEPPRLWKPEHRRAARRKPKAA